MIVRIVKDGEWWRVEVYSSGEGPIITYTAPEVYVVGLKNIKAREVVVEAERIELYMENNDDPKTWWVYVLPRGE